MAGASFALKSFTKVCEDLNINPEGKNISDLIENIDNIHKDGWNIVNGLKEKYNGSELAVLENGKIVGIEIKWENWETAVLHFDGKSYTWFDNMLELQEKTNTNIDSSLKNINESLNEVEALIWKQLKSKVGSIIEDLNNFCGTNFYKFNFLHLLILWVKYN